MAQVLACTYSLQGNNRPWPNEYWNTDDIHSIMADHLIGASSFWNVDSPFPLAMGQIEEGGHANNWMQIMYPGAFTNFVNNFWTPNNATGLTPTADELRQIDALNAAISVWWLTSATGSCNRNDWTLLARWGSAYNGWCSNCDSSCNSNHVTAYGWSALFGAYGANYQVANGRYLGPTITIPFDYSTGFPFYSSEPCTTTSQWVTTPTTSTYRSILNFPRGRNGSGKQIMLFAPDAPNFVNALGTDLKLHRAGIGTNGIMPTYTTDAAYADRAMKSSNICVIAIGSTAVSNLKSRGLTGYDSFSTWASGSGFIDAGTSLTNAQAFTKAYNETLAARNSGF